tara:strand:- start:919 stop:1383 length:465 start_codon:yes stop_codon:yes gene_type:complete
MLFEFTEEIFKWSIIGIIAFTTVIIAPKIALITRQMSSKSQKKLQQLDLEYIEELEHRLKQYKNKANNMEKGPTVTGDPSELDAILPELFGSFEQYAPRWLKPFLGNKDTQKFLIDYAQKNPEKVQGIIQKMVKKTVTKDGGSETANKESELSV